MRFRDYLWIFSIPVAGTMERGGATISEPRTIRTFMTWIVPNLESQVSLGLDLSSFLCTKNWWHAKNVLPHQKRITLQSSGLKDCACTCKVLHQLLLAYYLLLHLLNNILKEQIELLYKTTITSILVPTFTDLLIGKHFTGVLQFNPLNNLKK